MSLLCNLGNFLGRILLGLIFIVAGINKIVGFQDSVKYMQANGITEFTHILLASALFIELVCGFLIIAGYQTKWAALILFLFLIPTTFIFHAFWNAAEPEKNLQSILFFKNLAIMGGLVILAAASPGAISLDCLSKCRSHSDGA